MKTFMFGEKLRDLQAIEPHPNCEPAACCRTQWRLWTNFSGGASVAKMAKMTCSVGQKSDSFVTVLHCIA